MSGPASPSTAPDEWVGPIKPDAGFTHPVDQVCRTTWTTSPAAPRAARRLTAGDAEASPSRVEARLAAAAAGARARAAIATAAEQMTEQRAAHEQAARAKRKRSHSDGTRERTQRVRSRLALPTRSTRPTKDPTLNRTEER